MSTRTLQPYSVARSSFIVSQRSRVSTGTATPVVRSMSSSAVAALRGDSFCEVSSTAPEGVTSMLARMPLRGVIRLRRRPADVRRRLKRPFTASRSPEADVETSAKRPYLSKSGGCPVTQPASVSTAAAAGSARRIRRFIWSCS